LQSVFDETWRRQAMSGSEVAIKTLLGQVLQPLYGFCLYRVGKNRHWCEDVVQETMLRALNDLPSYDPARSGNNIFPWLVGGFDERLAENERLLDLSRGVPRPLTSSLRPGSTASIPTAISPS
jgi:hypothetical protein